MSSKEQRDGSLVNKIAGLPKALKRKRTREVFSTRGSDTESVGSCCTLNQEIDIVKGENVRFWTLCDDRALMTQLCNVRRQCAPYINYKWMDPMMWSTITEKVNLSLKDGSFQVEEVKDRTRYYKNQVLQYDWKLKIPCTELILLIEEAYRKKDKGPPVLPKSSRLRSTPGSSSGLTAAHSGYAQPFAIIPPDLISATKHMYDLLQKIRGQLTTNEYFWGIRHIGSNEDVLKMCMRMSHKELVLYLKYQFTITGF